MVPGKGCLHSLALTLKFFDVINGLLGERKTQARHTGDLGRQSRYIICQGVSRTNLIHHAHLIRPLGTHFIASEEKLFCDPGV